MPHIAQLDSHVADLIAAGEVVERPASVVKELVENAIDAGAGAVVVEIRRGGMGLIRVTDDGCGIARPEVPTAFLRHATSKLRSAEDLGRIGTLGFRGEALAAISAVSRVRMVTRRREDTAASVLELEGGVPGTVTETGAPAGTTISVSDLFYNTPARLKFMRKDSAETAAVAGLMQHLALSHPDISFKFIKDGTESLHTPGDGKLLSAVYSAMGRDFARSVTAVEGRGGEITVSGFVTKPLMGRGSRSMQVFFVNGRFIKSQLLTAALEEGYRNQIMKGRFPGCVLSVTVPVTAVDVNVHPAKTQVKFAREHEVFDAVYHTVLDGLEQGGAPIPAAPQVSGTVHPRGDFFRTMDARTYREAAAPAAEKPALSASRPAAATPPAWNTERTAAVRVADSVPARPLYQSARTQPPAALGRSPASVAAPVRSGPEERPAPREETPESAAARPVQERGEGAADPTPAAEKFARPVVPAIPQMEEPVQQAIPQPEIPWRIAGEVLNTYIICEEDGGNVWLIDKHAAHERIHFDRLMAAKEPPMRQTLLAPAAVEPGREDAALLLDNLPLLEQLGFACEDFGDGAVLVREVPADLDDADVAATLEEIAGKLRAGRSPEERREALLHTMACKAAIKGGWKSDPRELQALVEKVQSGAVRFCPHGRPVAVKFTKYELEKMFKRA